VGIRLYKDIEARKLAYKLYPNNRVEVMIERFGKDRYEQSCKFEDWLKKFPIEHKEEKIRQLLPNYDEINDFWENGFGRFNKETYDLLLDQKKSGRGTTDNPELVAKIAISMNIREKVSGFSWY